MTLKTLTAAGAFALGLLIAMPHGAQAQGAPPVTVRIVDPPVDTPPPPGMSYIRFGEHEIEVSGHVQITALKSGMLIMLPDGAPPLPADLFDVNTLPDGRVGYVPKVHLDKISVITTGIARSSPIPVQFAQAIEEIGDVPQTHLGTLHKGEVVMSIPYRYKHPIRMSDDLSINGLFGTHVLAKKDEIGFDAGKFNGGQVSHHLLCFFNLEHGNPYASPDCFVKFPSPDGAFGLAEVSVPSNLPTSFQMSKFQATGVKAPPLETDNVTIDHDFHLDLLVGWWSDGGLELTWRSEGVRLQTNTVRPGPDGTVRLHIKGGTLVLRSDPTEHAKTLAEFQPDPASVPVVAPPSVASASVATIKASN